MSYLQDKKPCKSCGDLYDEDLLKDGECRDCQLYDPRDHDDWLEEERKEHESQERQENGL